MKPLEWPLLADENIHPKVISYLESERLDVDSISRRGAFGLSDDKVLEQATEEGRVVLTHDRDFGGLALSGKRFVGIVYLRPGHIKADFTVRTLEAVRSADLDVTPPFILVAERTGEMVRIRVRQL